MARMVQSSLCSIYVGCAVMANLLVSRFGPAALPYTAFFLVGLDLVSRDILHEQWEGRTLWPKMGGLVVLASIVTWAVSPYAGKVALASSVSFGLAGASNAVVYWLLKARRRLVRMQGSNMVAAIVDSVSFPAIAFGLLSLSLSASQALAKILGGLVWSILYLRLRARLVQEAET